MEKKNVVSAIITVMAALAVFELGKTMGMLLVQFSLPIFFPVMFSGSEAAAEEFLNQQMMGVTLEAILGSILSLIMQCTGMLVCFILWRKEMRNKWVVYNLTWEPKAGRPLWQASLLVFTVAIAGCLGLNLIMNGLQLTLFSEEFLEVAESQTSVPVVFGVLMYGLVSPLAEEIVFRGVIYGKMKKAVGASTALPLAALFFAIYHGNIIQGVYAFLIGAVLCYLYEKSGSLWPAVIFHGVGNLAVYLIIGIGGVIDHIGNAAACVLGIGLTALAVWVFLRGFGKPELEIEKESQFG